LEFAFGIKARGPNGADFLELSAIRDARRSRRISGTRRALENSRDAGRDRGRGLERDRGPHSPALYRMFRRRRICAQ